MNRSLANWLLRYRQAGIAFVVVMTLQPLFGLLFFVPGAACVLYVLERSWRDGVMVTAGAAGVLALVSVLMGRPTWVAVLIATWPLLPSLLLGTVLRRSDSMSLVLQVAVLAGAAMVTFLHVVLGDPMQFGWIRDWMQGWTSALEVGIPDRTMAAQIVELLARTFWGWATVLTMLMALAGVWLGRWWQTQVSRPGSFAEEFQSQRLGRALGVASAVVLFGAVMMRNQVLADLAQPFLVALVLVGLAAAHRLVAKGRAGSWLLVVAYAALVLPYTSALALLVLVSWGFVDNWLRSQRPAQSA